MCMSANTHTCTHMNKHIHTCSQMKKKPYLLTNVLALMFCIKFHQRLEHFGGRTQRPFFAPLITLGTRSLSLLVTPRLPLSRALWI